MQEKKTPKIRYVKLISYAILILVVYFAAIYLAQNPALLQHLNQIRPRDFVFLSTIVLVSFLVNGYRTRVLTEVYTGKNLHFKDWFGLSMINSLGNYSPFQGGFLARGYYLKNYYHVPYSHFASSILASTVLTFSDYGLLSCVAIIINYLLTGAFYQIPFFVLLGMAISGFALLALFPKLKRVKSESGYIFKKLKSFIEGWETISGNRRCLRDLIFADIMALTVMSLQFFTAARIMSVGINYFQSIIIAAMATISLLINITPGALGIREAIIGFTGSLVGSGFSQNIIAATLERSVIVFWIFVVGVPFSIYFARHLNRNRT